VDFVAAIRREADLFYGTARSADPDFGVPSCPGWDVGDLVWHLGEVHWFWAADIEMRATDPAELEKAKPSRPGDYGGLVDWGRAQTDRLIDLLKATPDDVPVWTWARDESDHSVGFIRRHQVQETAVHRWDIQAAATTDLPDPVEPEAASDAIDEVLTVTLPWGVRPDEPLRANVHIQCTDTPGEWIIHPDGRVERLHVTGAVAIRGPASDVLLALYERLAIDNLDLFGDVSLAREFVSRINTA
jgi:uncharacterized protein (TIGR03083 family)